MKTRTKETGTNWREAAEVRLQHGLIAGIEPTKKYEDETLPPIRPESPDSPKMAPTIEDIEREWEDLTRRLEQESQLLKNERGEYHRSEKKLQNVVARTHRRASSVDCFLTSVSTDKALEPKDALQHFPNYQRELAIAATERSSDNEYRKHGGISR